MAVTLSFLGAAGTVTGSRYLFEAGGRRLLVDCGLFQGYKQLRLRNWSPPPLEAADLGACPEISSTFSDSRANGRWHGPSIS